jgi:hypothetical protein
VGDQAAGDQGVGGRLEACELAKRRHGVEEQSGLLFQVHPRQEIGHPLLDRAARILIGVQPAILVQIAIKNAVLALACDAFHGSTPHRGFRDSARPVQ